MKLPRIILAVTVLASFTTPVSAQSAANQVEIAAPAQKAPSVQSAGDASSEGADPAVLENCRQQAVDQKLEEGPALRAFMGTCISPED